MAKNHNYYIQDLDFYFGDEKAKADLINSFFFKLYTYTNNFKLHYTDGVSEWEDEAGNKRTVFIIEGKVIEK